MHQENNNPSFFMPVSSDDIPMHLPSEDNSRPLVDCMSNARCVPDLPNTSESSDILLGQRKRQWVWIDGIRPRWI